MAIGGSKNSSKQSSTTTNPYAVQQFQSAQSALGGSSYKPLSGDQINGFMNPYTSSVIDANMARAQQDQAGQINQIGDAATQAHAFGGSRHGVAEGIARGQFDLNNQQMGAQLRQAGYSQALQTAQGENSAANQYPLLLQQLLGQLAQGTTSNSSGKSSGSQLGFSWSPNSGFN